MDQHVRAAMVVARSAAAAALVLYFGFVSVPAAAAALPEHAAETAHAHGRVASETASEPMADTSALDTEPITLDGDESALESEPPQTELEAQESGGDVLTSDGSLQTDDALEPITSGDPEATIETNVDASPSDTTGDSLTTDGGTTDGATTEDGLVESTGAAGAPTVVDSGPVDSAPEAASAPVTPVRIAPSTTADASLPPPSTTPAGQTTGPITSIDDTATSTSAPESSAVGTGLAAKTNAQGAAIATAVGATVAKGSVVSSERQPLQLALSVTPRESLAVPAVFDALPMLTSDDDGLLGIASGAAIPSAGLIVGAPRVPGAVAVAMEFGRAGHGWAGALVFNLWLRRELRERRMTQRQLAALSGVSHSTISRLLADGRSPSLETATKLAHALRLRWTDDKVAAYFDLLSERTIVPTQRVEAALRGDDELSDEDVRALMTAYLVRRARRRRVLSGGSGDPRKRPTRDSGSDGRHLEGGTLPRSR